MMGLDGVKTITVARVSLVLTVLLFLVSLVSLLFQWYLVNGCGVDVLVFPLLFEYTPLGLVYSGNIIYLWSPVFKLQMDFLFLVPYTLAMLVTGPVTVFSYPLSRIVGCEKFGEAKNWARTNIKDVKRGKRSIYTAVLIIIINYVWQLLSYFIKYTELPVGALLWLGYPYVFGISGLIFANLIVENVIRRSRNKEQKVKQKNEKVKQSYYERET